MLPLCFCAFLVFGVVLVLVGANQASLAADLSLDLARSGLLASSLALGLGVGVVVAGPLFDRHARRPLFVGSALLAAAALLGVERGMSYTRWLAHAALAGAGIGLYDTLINAMIVQRYREHAARPMLAVHSAATIGAMFGPPLVGWIAAAHHFTASFHAAGFAHVAIAAWAAFLPMPAPEPRSVRSGEALGGLALTRLLPIAAVAFAYVGVEASVTVFAVPYASEALALPAERGRLAISAFWLGLLAGRLALLGARTDLGARVLIAAGAGAAVLLIAAAALPRAPLELALFGVGAALGCVYPLMIALAGQTAPKAAGTAAGLAAGAGALGGFAVPWITGAAGDATGIAVGFGSLALWCAAIALAAVASRRVG